jgi:DNA gyrase/topoisomerase IV subunit B
MTSQEQARYDENVHVIVEVFDNALDEVLSSL